MPLIEHTLFGVNDKVKIAIKRLQTFEPKEGYYLAFSGGKDSIVIKKLADMSGVKYDAHYNNTTIDPPPLVRLIKDKYVDVEIHNPEKSFFRLLVEKGFPMRQHRWCCKYLKEGGGAGRTVITGVRWAESHKRSKRKMVEQCRRSAGKHYMNVIIDWEDGDVWDFIKNNSLSYCSLYDEGYKRLGCLMCPMSNKREKEAERFPRYKRAFMLAFDRFYERKKHQENVGGKWGSSEEMFYWWLKEQPKKGHPDQMVMFE